MAEEKGRITDRNDRVGSALPENRIGDVHYLQGVICQPTAFSPASINGIYMKSS